MSRTPECAMQPETSHGTKSFLGCSLFFLHDYICRVYLLLLTSMPEKKGREVLFFWQLDWEC